MSTIRWLLLADFLLSVAILAIAIVTDLGMLLPVVFVGALNLVWILLDLRKGSVALVGGLSGAPPTMSPNARYWTLHWLRVLLWPLPVLTLFRAGRGALNLVRR